MKKKEGVEKTKISDPGAKQSRRFQFDTTVLHNYESTCILIKIGFRGKEKNRKSRLTHGRWNRLIFRCFHVAH